MLQIRPAHTPHSASRALSAPPLPPAHAVWRLAMPPSLAPRFLRHRRTLALAGAPVRGPIPMELCGCMADGASILPVQTVTELSTICGSMPPTRPPASPALGPGSKARTPAPERHLRRHVIPYKTSRIGLPVVAATRPTGSITSTSSGYSETGLRLHQRHRQRLPQRSMALPAVSIV